MSKDVKHILKTKNYAKVYRNYLKAESKVLKGFVKKGRSLIEVGCGTGRVIPIVAPLVRHYVGVDIDLASLEQANETAERYGNVEIFQLDAVNLSKRFRANEFDLAIMPWNVLNVVKQPLKSLKEVYRVTKRGAFVTVPQRGTLAKRLGYYRRLKIRCRIDKKTETIYSAEWGASRAYSKSGIRSLCERAGFRVQSIKDIRGLGYCVLLRK